jgi:hypothetical protein
METPIAKEQMRKTWEIIKTRIIMIELKKIKTNSKAKKSSLNKLKNKNYGN